MSPTIQELVDFGDYFPLFKILRLHPDPRQREQAALAIPALNHPDGVEALIRATLSDPDREVQMAARNALERLLGKQEAPLAIAAYGAVEDILPYEASPTAPSAGVDDELDPDYDLPDEVDPENLRMIHAEIPTEFMEFSSSPPTDAWDEEHIAALILILQDDSQPERQAKALRVLAQHPTPAAIDALSFATLWSENPSVQTAARQALEERYAEDTGRLLADYRAIHQGLDVEEDEEEDNAPPSPDPRRSPSHPAGSPSVSSLEPEGMSARTLVILFAILIVLGLLAVWLLSR